MESNNIFPDLSKYQSAAFEEKSVVLDGQKVLYDKKVTLMPVEIHKKKTKNGTEN